LLRSTQREAARRAEDELADLGRLQVQQHLARVVGHPDLHGDRPPPALQEDRHAGEGSVSIESLNADRGVHRAGQLADASGAESRGALPGPVGDVR